MKQNLDNLVLVAKLGKTVGLNGFVKLHIISDFPEQFKPNVSFFNENNEKITIKQINWANQTVQLFGFENIDNAKKLVNKELFDTKENTKHKFQLKKDEFFYFDIIGKLVYENNLELGIINDILDISNNFLFEVKTSKNLITQGFAKKFFIPYADKYIIEINDKVIVKNAKDILENS